MSAPEIWRNAKQRYNLTGYRCKKCGKTFFTKRIVCRKCKSKDLEEVLLPWEGAIETYTVVRSPIDGYETKVPYIIGLIKLKNGVRILSEIVDCEPTEIEKTKEVELVFRVLSKDKEKGLITYGFKFRPKT